MMQRIPLKNAVLAVAAGLALAGCDLLTSTDTRIERGGKALDEGRIQAAVADARTAAEKEPGHPGAWLLLARIGLKYGDGPGALKDLERATAAGASPEEIMPLQARALMLAGRFDDVIALQPGDAGTRVTRATALVAAGRQEEAAREIAAVLAADSRHVRARLINVQLLDAAGRREDARRALDELLADEPQSAEAEILKARAAMADGNSGAALAALERASQIAPRQLSIPEQAALQGALVESRLAAEQVDKAAAALAELRKLVPGAPVTEFLAARVSLAQGDAAAAVSTLQRVLAADPSMPQARLLLGAALIEQGATEQARTQLNSVIAEQPGNLTARQMLARLLVSQGDARGAERILGELPQGVQSDATTEWMRSALLAASGQRAEALAVLEVAAKAEPSNVQLQMELVRAYLAMGRQDQARSTLQAIPSRQDGWVGKQVKVLQRVAGQSGAGAKQALLALAQESPKDAELQTVIGETYLQFGDVPAAATHFRSALAADPGMTQARLGLAGVLVQQDDLAGAEQELRQVIAAEPSTERAYLGLAMVANRRGDGTAARKWLEQAIGAIPSASLARLALAELSYQANLGQAADALLDQVVTMARDKPAALQRVGSVQLRSGQPARAAATFERAHAQRPSGQLAVQLSAARSAAKQPGADTVLRDWLKTQPEDAAVRTALADFLLHQGTYPEAIAEYERLTKQVPAPALLNNLAWLYQTTRDNRAEATAKRAYDAAPGSAQIADTYGWILLEKGRAAEALPLLTSAAEALPDNAEIQEHLKQARAQAGGG